LLFARVFVWVISDTSFGRNVATPRALCNTGT